VVVVVPGALLVVVVAPTVVVVAGSVVVVVVELMLVVDVVDGAPMLVEVAEPDPESPPQAATNRATVASRTGRILLIVIRRNEVCVWVTESLVAFLCACLPRIW
jgi:hypothetical protein